MFTDLYPLFAENIWDKNSLFGKLAHHNLIAIGMVHFFNALIILLFFMILALFSNIEAKKHNEVFTDALQVYHTDSVRTSDKREPTDLQRLSIDKQ
ncbi:hypothetical protein D3C87_499130 [compost metagenome]